MDELVKRLELATADVVMGLDTMEFQQLESFVNEREDIIAQMMQSNMLEQDKVRLKNRVVDTLKHDAVIVARMNELKNEASVHLAKLQASRVHRNGYESSYSDTSSMFLDSRK